jgi:hypothetical protein
MENKLKRFFIIIVVFLAGFFFASVHDLGICDLHNDFCGEILMEMFGQSLGFYSMGIFMLFLLLSFMKEAVFQSWWRFAKWYLGIAAALIVITPGTGGGGLFIGMGGGYDREGMIWFTSGLFFIISIILITKKAIQTHGREDNI